MRLGSLSIPFLYLFLLFIPASIILEALHAKPVWVFFSAALGIVPLAGLMGEVTESLSRRAGPAIGGLLNATFGNAAELIIALVALKKGLYDVVKASITGSIIGNILLVLGLSIFLGGLKYKRQTFNRTAAGLGGTLLTLSTIGLVVPALFHFIVRDTHPEYEKELSLAIAVILFLTYILSLVFSLFTHRDLYDPGPHKAESHDTQYWSTPKALSLLFLATAGVAVMSELLVSAVEPTAKAFGMTEVFVGVILVAIIGNAAEHSTAVLMARKDQMDLAVNIAVGSSIQIALFVAPVLVFVSHLFKNPMNLIFTDFEVLSVGLSVWVLNLVAQDGESNWMEGVQLLAVYIILAVAFYFLPR